MWPGAWPGREAQGWPAAPVSRPAVAAVAPRPSAVPVAPGAQAHHFHQANHFEHGPLPLRLEAEPIVHLLKAMAARHGASQQELSDLWLLPSNACGQEQLQHSGELWET
eukprot:symbB.v1.2.033644.t1/scaffold4209.1/size43054/5